MAANLTRAWFFGFSSAVDIFLVYLNEVKVRHACLSGRVLRKNVLLAGDKSTSKRGALLAIAGASCVPRASQ